MSESENEPGLNVSPARVFRDKKCVKCDDHISNNGGTCVASPADMITCIRIRDYTEFMD